MDFKNLILTHNEELEYMKTLTIDVRKYQDSNKVEIQYSSKNTPTLEKSPHNNQLNNNFEIETCGFNAGDTNVTLTETKKNTPKNFEYYYSQNIHHRDIHITITANKENSFTTEPYLICNQKYYKGKVVDVKKKVCEFNVNFNDINTKNPLNKTYEDPMNMTVYIQGLFQFIFGSKLHVVPYFIQIIHFYEPPSLNSDEITHVGHSDGPGDVQPGISKDMREFYEKFYKKVIDKSFDTSGSKIAKTYNYKDYMIPIGLQKKIVEYYQAIKSDNGNIPFIFHFFENIPVDLKFRTDHLYVYDNFKTVFYTISIKKHDDVETVKRIYNNLTLTRVDRYYDLKGTKSDFIYTSLVNNKKYTFELIFTMNTYSFPKDVILFFDGVAYKGELEKKGLKCTFKFDVRYNLPHNNIACGLFVVAISGDIFYLPYMFHCLDQKNNININKRVLENNNRDQNGNGKSPKAHIQKMFQNLGNKKKKNFSKKKCFNYSELSNSMIDRKLTKLLIKLLLILD